MEPGKKNLQHLPLVESSQILLTPLHVKLGRMKNFVRAVDHTGTAFGYLAEKFPGKIKEGVSIDPQIRQLYRDDQLDRILSGNDRRTSNDFEVVAPTF